MGILLARSICIFLAAVPATWSSANDLRPFTVADSISMTRFADPPTTLAKYRQVHLNSSPDRQWVAFVTRKGNLQSGMNEYALHLMRESEILGALNSSSESSRPESRVAAAFATDSFKHAIEQATWTADGQNVAFIGRGRGAAGKVYAYDIRSGQLKQLTSHATDIVGFDLSRDRRTLVYSAYQPRDWTDRNRRGYVVRSEFAFEFGTNDPSEARHEFSHHVRNLETEHVTRIRLPNSVSYRRFDVSPSGRRAVVLAQVYELPTHWGQYEFISRYDAQVRESLDIEETWSSPQDAPEYDAAFAAPAPWINQYHLVDLETGEAAPLLDAPAILTAGDVRAIWAEDESSLILPSTYLPLGDSTADERERRLTLRAVVEMDLRSRTVRRIADQPELTADGRHRLILMELKSQSDGGILIRKRRYPTNEEIVQHYRKIGTEWLEQRDITGELAAKESRLQLAIVQDMNTAPEIVATDTQSGRRRAVTDLNPQLRELALGTVDPFDWTDRLGRMFRGGLVFPPGYQRGRKYPVVIQTYGFHADEFLIDGPKEITTAYAARALASKDLLVLQMPDDLERAPESTPERCEDGDENRRFLIGLEDAIEALYTRSLIDPARIGLVGFSREGMHVHYAVTFSTRRFAAAVVSDSITATPFSYVLVYGAPRPGMLEWERDGLIGAPLWGKGVDLWVKRSPLFHLKQIRTPLRLEAIGIGIPALWETFAILKRHHRPVELIHIPKDSHVLQTPWGRNTSQQGTVDWFDFWLNDREGTGAEKAAQYQRWRILRRQHEASNRTTPSDRGERASGTDEACLTSATTSDAMAGPAASVTSTTGRP